MNAMNLTRCTVLKLMMNLSRLVGLAAVFGLLAAVPARAVVRGPEIALRTALGAEESAEGRASERAGEVVAAGEQAGRTQTTAVRGR